MLAARVGLGTRRVQAMFRDDVGLAPKQLVRITRLQRALQLRRGRPSLTWSAVAARAGYYDHAHLVRDANAIAGRPPSSLVVDEPGLTATFLSDAG
jgi:AraC-like DNA-binding protein